MKFHGSDRESVLARPVVHSSQSSCLGHCCSCKENLRLNGGEENRSAEKPVVLPQHET